MLACNLHLFHAGVLETLVGVFIFTVRTRSLIAWKLILQIQSDRQTQSGDKIEPAGQSSSAGTE